MTLDMDVMHGRYTTFKRLNSLPSVTSTWQLCELGGSSSLVLEENFKMYST